jgi:hypothetical protein
MLITAAKIRGMTLQEMDELTIGQGVDFIIQYNNIMLPAEEEKTRKATQADWDNF